MGGWGGKGERLETESGEGAVRHRRWAVDVIHARRHWSVYPTANTLPPKIQESKTHLFLVNGRAPPALARVTRVTVVAAPLFEIMMMPMS